MAEDDLPPMEFFRTLMRKVRRVPFSYVIKSTAGVDVIPLGEEDEGVLNEIYKASVEVVQESQGEDFSSLRPNEMGNRLEQMLRAKLRGVIPENKAAGYPDMLLERGGNYYYVEVKLAEEGEMGSSLRTFYYEPTELPKVRKSARHVIVGFLHRSRKVVGFKVVDASRIRVDLKVEFNASNLELYRGENVLREYWD